MLINEDEGSYAVGDWYGFYRCEACDVCWTGLDRCWICGNTIVWVTSLQTWEPVPEPLVDVPGV